MSKSCIRCGGLIMEPNKAYGYAGPVCYCQPQYIVPQGHPINNYPSYNPPMCQCHDCTQARRHPMEKSLSTQSIKQIVFTAEDFQQIYNKIIKEGYISWSAGDMWEPAIDAQDIADIANGKLKS